MTSEISGKSLRRAATFSHSVKKKKMAENDAEIGFKKVGARI